MQTNKRSDKHLTLYHILPSERACLLVEGLLATGQVVPRSMVLIATADAVNWDDEVMLVRPSRVGRSHNLPAMRRRLRATHPLPGSAVLSGHAEVEARR